MVLGIADSVNGLDAVENPDYILISRRGAFAAVIVLGLSVRVEQKMDKAKIVWRKENQEE